MKKYLCLLLMLVAAFLGCNKTEKNSAQIETIDGIPHVMNTMLPLKGTVQLELEPLLKIDPYEHEEIGLKYYHAVKDKDGEVILFDSYNAEAERFTKDGEYIGNFIKKGQGPGEFSEGSNMRVFCIDSQIWVTGSQKLAKFDKQGNFIEDIKFGDLLVTFIENNLYVIDKTTRTGEDSFKQIMIKKILENQEVGEGPVLMEGTNLGMIRIPRGGFGDDWATPDISYAVDRNTKKIYVGLKSEYKIYAKDTEGNILYVIERPFTRVALSGKDKEKMLEIFIRFQKDQKQILLDAYPDHLMAFKDMKVLPKGFLAVYRISGLKQYEIDIFDDKGRYIYKIEPLENVSLDEAVFYDFGFSTVETVDDFPVYVEYRIKNLPEIFNE